METVAVFFEEPVRTYGIKGQDGCLLLSLECSPEQLTRLARLMAALDPPLIPVSFGIMWEGETAIVQACLPEDQALRLAQVADQAGASWRGREAAAVVNLQGPHFGDRWGLAEKALTGLEEAGTAPLSLMGVTHTLQVVLRSVDVQAALAGLGKRFVAPETEHGG